MFLPSGTYRLTASYGVEYAPTATELDVPVAHTRGPEREQGVLMLWSTPSIHITETTRGQQALLPAEIRDLDPQLLELADGYAFRFPPKSPLLLLLAEFVSRERLCCPFFSFALKVDAGGKPFVLSITGPSGAKEVLYAELNLSTLVD